MRSELGMVRFLRMLIAAVLSDFRTDGQRLSAALRSVELVERALRVE